MKEIDMQQVQKMKIRTKFWLDNLSVREDFGHISIMDDYKCKCKGKVVPVFF
jgi:hypothetical protein